MISPPDDAVAQLEKCMTKIAWTEYRRCLRELGTHQLTYPQFHTMLAIRRTEPECSMGMLAVETDQVSATMTGIIDRLVEHGWVERYRPPGDRRQVRVRLTAEGHQKLQDVFTLRQQHVKQILSQMDDVAQQQMISMFTKYLDVMESVIQNGNGR